MMLARNDCPFNEKEMEILMHISNGKTVKEVAYTMKISVPSVQGRVADIRRKHGRASSMPGIVAHAIRRGWI